MTTVLDRIKAYKLDEVAAAKAARPIAEVEAAARAAPAPRGFADRLRAACETGYGLIAEVKKASPSKGLIRADFDPPALARAYEAGGASCLSVLTDGPSFQGAPEYLAAARDATGLPALRKDFMYDAYQVAEARAWGADCILIIMASVGDAQARELEDAATAGAWTCSSRSMTRRSSTGRWRALSASGDKQPRSQELRHRCGCDPAARAAVPEDRLVISESGLNTAGDLAGLAADGVRAFLIGESLMRQADVEAATRALLADPLRAAV
jgi:indole-3-glycerol phosphate synthase